MRPSCLCDTTFIPVNRPYSSPWEYYNVAKKSHGFLYQVVCSLGKPFRILHFDGPFKGSAADVSIFRSTIVPMLKEGEKVMTDRGYYQETLFCWSPPTGKFLSQEQMIERRKVTAIRHLNERVISRLKDWGVLRKKWRKSWQFQEECVHVVSRLTQLELHAYPLT